VWIKYNMFIVKPAVTRPNHYALNVCMRSELCTFINIVLLFHVISYALCFKCVSPVLLGEKHNRARATSPICYQEHVPSAYTEQ